MCDSGLEMLDGPYTAGLYIPLPTSSNNLVSTVHSVINQKTVFLYFYILENACLAVECYCSGSCIVS
jgi:hypothetical protein